MTVAEFDGDGFLKIAESGHDVSVETTGARSELQIPPRYGVTWVAAGSRVDPGTATAVAIRRAFPLSSAGEVRVALICGDDALDRWERGFAAVATEHVARRGASVLADFRRALAVPDLVPPNSRSAAWIRHVEAQLLLLNERSSESARAFERAEAAWLQAGDAARASAARVAFAEDLQRSGDYEGVLAVASMVVPGADPYFAARLRGTRCLALRSLGRSAEALACFEDAIAALGAIGEELERLSTIQDYALLSADLDRLDESERLARLALDGLQRFDAIPGPAAHTVRGRTHLLLADIALRRGDVASALRECDAALASFTTARATRWQGNALLRVAEVYGALGMTTDALGVAEEALSRFSPRDAPTRVAATTLARARLQLELRNYVVAALLATEASVTFAARKSAPELEHARLVQGAALLRAGLRFDPDSLPPAQAPNRIARSLLLIESDLAGGALDRASSRLDDLRRSKFGPAVRIEVDRLTARLHDLRGRHDEADALRWRAAGELLATASRARSAVLFDLLLRKLEPMRRDANAALLGRASSDAQAVSQLLQWALVDKLARPPRPAQPDAAAEFDALLARELLPYGGSSADRVAIESRSRSLEALLDFLAAASAPAQGVESDEGALAARVALAPGDALLAFVDGGDTSAALIASPREIRVVAIPDRSAFVEALARLATQGSDAATPLDRLESDARLIGAQLFGELSPAPNRLFVLGDGGLDAVPWGLVPTRGGDALVDTTDVVLVTRAGVRREPMQHPASLELLIAESGASDLPVLLAASREPALLEGVLRARNIAASVPSVASRERVLDAFAGDRAWVHVAAHGVTAPRRLGRSGIWTAGIGGEEFLSWLDPMSRGVRADLVVLNACALAQSDASGDRSALNFAAALSRAGARNVVAAMWPISDTASSVWVPAFYAALLDGDPDAARATRAAQRALRETRRFRHPAHWAGLVHIGELPLSS